MDVSIKCADGPARERRRKKTRIARRSTLGFALKSLIAPGVPSRPPTRVRRVASPLAAKALARMRAALAAASPRFATNPRTSCAARLATYLFSSLAYLLLSRSSAASSSSAALAAASRPTRHSRMASRRFPAHRSRPRVFRAIRSRSREASRSTAARYSRGSVPSYPSASPAPTGIFGAERCSSAALDITTGRRRRRRRGSEANGEVGSRSGGSEGVAVCWVPVAIVPVVAIAVPRGAPRRDRGRRRRRSSSSRVSPSEPGEDAADDRGDRARRSRSRSYPSGSALAAAARSIAFETEYEGRGVRSEARTPGASGGPARSAPTHEPFWASRTSTTTTETPLALTRARRARG